MNSLSWLIYLSRAVDSLKDLFFSLSLVGTIVMGIGWVVYGITEGDAPTKPKTWCYFTVLGLAVLCCITPNTAQIRAIAASEFADRVYNSKQIQGIVNPGLKYIEQWLTNQSKPDQK